MKKALAPALLLSVSIVLPGGAARAQQDFYRAARPMFMALPPHGVQAPHLPSQQLTQWSATFTDLTGVKHKFIMPGTSPATTTTTTFFGTLIIPIKMVYGKTNGNMTFDPMTDIGPNGDPVSEDTFFSPVFNSSIDYVQGGTDLGATQYIDAFQRGNFWYSVHKNGGGYHVLFEPGIGTEFTIHVSSSQGKVITNPFGTNKVGIMDHAAFDAALQGFIKKLGINPSQLPFFLTDNIFLLDSQGNCCTGGYHSSVGGPPGGQTYSYATYVTQEGSFCQDISCETHELGEWMDDPFVDNHVSCTDNSIMEVGDPLESSPNYGDYAYNVSGAIYNLQSLVFIGYFGGKADTSMHSWLAFQNDMNHVCPGQ